MASRWHGVRLADFSFGHESRERALAWLRSRALERGADPAPDEPLALLDGPGPLVWLYDSRAGGKVRSDHVDSILANVARLRVYAAGEADELASIVLDDAGLTSFRRRVTEACRQIPYGTTLSYAELAERVGAPRAARAVGNVMRTNPWPLIIPCHRVIGSGGGLGGYSAPEGLTMKKRLLAMEAAAVPATA